MKDIKEYLFPYCKDISEDHKFLKLYARTSEIFSDIYVYSLNNIKRINAKFIEDTIDLLPTYRREKCLKLKSIPDKTSCIISFLFLKEGLRKHFGINDVPLFEFNEHGKPYLGGTKDVYFSISHSKNTVVCAIARFEIGVDVENMRNVSDSLIKRTCNEREISDILKSWDKQKAFLKLWTMKESYAKAYGKSVTEVFTDDIPKDYFIYIDEGEYFFSIYTGRLLEEKISMCNERHKKKKFLTLIDNTKTKRSER